MNRLAVMILGFAIVGGSTMAVAADFGYRRHHDIGFADKWPCDRWNGHDCGRHLGWWKRWDWKDWERRDHHRDWGKWWDPDRKFERKHDHDRYDRG